MRVDVILVPGAPEEGPNAAGAFNGAVGEVEGNDHRAVYFGTKTDNMRSEGFGVLGILLKALDN